MPLENNWRLVNWVIPLNCPKGDLVLNCPGCQIVLKQNLVFLVILKTYILFLCASLGDLLHASFGYF